MLNNHTDRAHALLSASSAHRWIKCPPSALVAAMYPEQDSEFTREGTLAHEIAELVARREELVGVAFRDGTTQEMFDCAAEYADYIEEQIQSDDAVVLLEQRVDFSPWVPEGFGTTDCIIIQGHTMDVIDYKFGQGVSVSAVENPQEMLYGLGALNDYGIAYDIELIRLHIFQPRLNNVSVWEISTDELMDWAENVVKPAAELAYEGKGEYAAGDWCKFCPHAGRCRTLTSICIETIEHHGGLIDVPVLSPDEVAEILRKEATISLWLKRVKSQAMASMLSGEQVPGYKVVEGKLGNRKWSDEIKVLNALKAAGYDTEDVTELKLLSPAAMDKAVGKKKVAELLSEMIDRAPGAPIIVPETDKRPAYSTADDFEDLGG